MATMVAGVMDGSAASAPSQGKITSKTDVNQYKGLGSASANQQCGPHRAETLAKNPLHALTGRDIVAAAGSGFGSALVDRHVAIVDPLLVHPLPAEPFFSGQLRWRGCGGKRFAFPCRIT
jgi:hypothetical protein